MPNPDLQEEGYYDAPLPQIPSSHQQGHKSIPDTPPNVEIVTTIYIVSHEVGYETIWPVENGVSVNP